MSRLLCLCCVVIVKSFPVLEFYVVIITILSIYTCISWSYSLTILIGVTVGKIEDLKKEGKMRIIILIFINTIHLAYLKVYPKFVKNSKWLWSGKTITNRRQPHGTARKSHSTITRHQEDKFPINMIAILEWT